MCRGSCAAPVDDELSSCVGLDRTSLEYERVVGEFHCFAVRVLRTCVSLYASWPLCVTCVCVCEYLGCETTGLKRGRRCPEDDRYRRRRPHPPPSVIHRFENFSFWSSLSSTSTSTSSCSTHFVLWINFQTESLISKVFGLLIVIETRWAHLRSTIPPSYIKYEDSGVTIMRFKIKTLLNIF